MSLAMFSESIQINHLSFVSRSKSACEFAWFGLNEDFADLKNCPPLFGAHFVECIH